MKIIASERAKKEYGKRIREAAPGVKLITPSAVEGVVQWSADPSSADVCLFSEDMWQEPDLRRTLLPALFGLTELKWFHTFSAGTDAAAFKVLMDRGTILTNSSGASAPSIAQYVLAMMLYRTKPIEDWRESQARAAWEPTSAGELTGQTVGIVGTGAIGGEVARLSKAFGMRTIGVRRSTKRTPNLDVQLPPNQLLRMLKHADFVVLACPLTPETEGLIGEHELRAMKPTASLINVARGRVCDEGALIRALEENWIAGAALDVFHFEPLPEQSPLWSLPNVIVTPHNSGMSPRNMARMMEIFLENLARYAAGKPLRNRVQG